MGYTFAFSQTDTSKNAAPGTAPPTPPATLFSGSVDAYYRHHFNAPASKANNLTDFTNSNNSFELGMVSLRADNSFGSVSATSGLGFGRRADEFSYNDTASRSLISLALPYRDILKFRPLPLYMKQGLKPHRIILFGQQTGYRCPKNTFAALMASVYKF